MRTSTRCLAVCPSEPRPPTPRPPGLQGAPFWPLPGLLPVLNADLLKFCLCESSLQNTTSCVLLCCFVIFFLLIYLRICGKLCLISSPLVESALASHAGCERSAEGSRAASRQCGSEARLVGLLMVQKGLGGISVI